MAYATADDYALYGSGQIGADDLDRLLEQASDQIDGLTYNRIPACGFASLTPFRQTSVKKAVCRQADFVYQYGDFLALPLAGYSAGSVSLSFGGASGVYVGGGGVQTTEAVASLLRATGFTNRGLC